MTCFASILLPLDGSPEAAKGAGCALWLTEALGATLHVLHATAHPLPAHDALARLRVAHAEGPRVVMHQGPANAEAAVLEEIATHCIDLVVMTARGESASGNVARPHGLGSVARAIIEHTRVPVVLLAARYREALPWTSLLAAASGEVASNQALEVAVHLAAALRLRLTVAHCEDGAVVPRPPPLGAYADAPHHEYPPRLTQLLERGMAGCTAEESHCVHDVVLCRGEPASALLEQAARSASSLLALGWHGDLGVGRAKVFKRLLEEAECALLVVRGSEHSRAELRIESEIDAN